jgi:glycerol-3-phosphate dehydrogenase
MGDLCRDLKVKIQYIGKLTVAQDQVDMETLESPESPGEANGVPGLEIIDKDRMQQIQPGVGGIQALHSPTTGIICPYGLTMALADNARENGVDFHLGSRGNRYFKNRNRFSVKTTDGVSVRKPGCSSMPRVFTAMPSAKCWD